MNSKFQFLTMVQPALAQLGAEAEALYPADPHGCISALGQLAEALTAELFSTHNIPIYEDYSLFERIERLREDGLLSPGAAQSFHALRMAREDVDRGKLKFSAQEAAYLLHTAQALAKWCCAQCSTPSSLPSPGIDFL